MSSTASTADAPLLRLPPGRAVAKVAGPMVALGLLRSGYLLTDTYWVKPLGAEALAGLGGAAFAWWMVHLTAEVGGTGVHARVAQLEGAGQRAEIPRTVAQGAFVGLGFWAVLAVLAVLGPDPYFAALDFAPGSAERVQGAAWLRAAMLGSVTLGLQVVLDAAFRGLGHTGTALKITAVTLVANFALDPLLIHGVGGFDGLGIAGAAWATALSNAVGATLAAVLLAREGLAPRWFRPSLQAMRKLASIGGPISAGGVAFCLVYVALGRLISEFGTVHVGALGVGHRIESLAYLVCVGFGVGASTMVGQHLGAGDEGRAAASAHAAARLAALAMLPMSLGAFVFAAPLSHLLADPATAAASTVYLRWQAMFWVLMAAETAYQGAFSGSGHTVPAFAINLVGTVLRIPAAWLLAFPLGMGIDGVWLAIAGSTAIKGLAMAGWFARGTWRQPTVTTTASSPQA
jgi:putative MATE family efflux protein